MKKQLLYLLTVITVAVIALMTGCQKETSFELPDSPSKGSLQADATGDCLPKTVNGIYSVGAALIPATNTITVQVNVTQVGTYVVSSDTVNGYFFRATGTFTTVGAATVTLRGSGTPFAQGINNFVISFDGTVCDVSVTVLPAGAGAATFTLDGSPNCTTPTINGTYTVGVPLTAANTVVLNVNVTVAGSYNISTAAVNGMTFSGTGTLVVGPQTITLTGSGTPTTSGANNIPITAGASTCSFTVTVLPGAGPATFTLVNGGVPANCASAVVSGTYTQGVALVAATNYVDITVNVTVIGSYTISATGGGMTFSKTGTFSATGNQTVRLDGSGTPTTSGANTITFAAPFASCSFTVTVAPGSSNCVCTLNGSPGNCAGATVNGIYVVGGTLTASHTVVLGVNVTTAGAYTVTTTTNGLTFSGSGSLALGPQTITLTASGSATVAGNNSFTVSVNGSPSCSFTVWVLPNDYLPRTTNTNWSYEYDDVANDSIYRYVIAATKVVAANTFNIFMYNDGSGPDSSGYYRRNGGDYFEWFDFGSFVGLDNPAWTEYILLKDNVALNTNWKTGAVCGTVGATPICVRWSYTIKLKDGPITITSSIAPAITYQNVIMVEEKLDYSLDGGTNWLDATSTVDYYGKSYYARGVGLILFEAYDASNALQFKQELRRFQIY